jgi:hypothetical protein
VANCGDAGSPVSDESPLLALHADGERDWQLPAILLAIVLTAAALKAARLGAGAPGSPRRTSARARAGVAGVASLGIIALAGPALSAGALAAARGGDLPRAPEPAGDAARLSTHDSGPVRLRASLLSHFGRRRDADRAFVAVVDRFSRDWTVFADWAFALRRRGDDVGAWAAAERTAELNPRKPRPRYLLEGPDR